MADVAASLPRRLAALGTALATAIVILALAIVPFLTPAWVSFEQNRTGAAELSGFSQAEIDAVTGEVLRDLVLGGDFAIETSAGERLLNDREVGHMQDVRDVFGAFALVAFVAVVAVVAAFLGARRLGHPERFWRATRGGAIGLAAGVVVAAGVVLVAFDVAFELFHRLFFAGGSYTFDPQTERLVQLFPFAFWSETTMAVGAVVVVLCAGVAVVAGRRLRAASSGESRAGAPAQGPGPVGAEAAR